MIRHPARRRPEDREPEWQARLNAFFSGHCEVVWFGTAAPDLVAVGPYQPEAEIAEAAAFERARLAEAGKPNEPHAVRDGVVDLTGEAPRIAYRVTDYGTVRALRRLRQGRNTGILSASSLPALASRATIYVHRRAAHLDLNPGRHHSFAGGFHPGKDRDLVAAAQRELGEEGGFDPASPPATLAKALFSDPFTGALELCLLGYPLSEEEAAAMKGSEEGAPVGLAPDDLAALLRHNERWGHGGQCEILAWLALGAAPFPETTRFAGRTAPALFEDLTREPYVLDHPLVVFGYGQDGKA